MKPPWKAEDRYEWQALIETWREICEEDGAQGLSQRFCLGVIFEGAVMNP